MDNAQLTALWRALDAQALELGQVDVVAAMLEQNRQLMLTYLDLHRQKAAAATPAPTGKPKAVMAPMPPTSTGR